MFSRVTFYPTLMYNIMMEKISSRRWFDRVDQTVILGALPWKSLSKELIEKENVKGVISMNENFEFISGVTNPQDWNRLGIKFLQLKTKDIFHSPTLEQIKNGVQFIKEFEENGSVYVHCKAGRTRSATLVACYLIQKHNWDPQTAVNFISSKRPHILLKSKQWSAINNYYSQINLKLVQSNDLNL